MSKYNFSYSSIEDVYAVASEESGSVRKQLFELAEALERVGVGYYDGEEYRYVPTPYGMEVISVTDLESEEEEEENW